jgi:hypothetical protein
MKPRILLPIFLVFTSVSLFGQYPQKVVVEHTTNTLCGNCANRNPGFYQNLENHPDVIHIAYHPSSPYAACQLNQHNKAENDGRTMYYGIFGSTPRLVIQGNTISAGTNYSNASIFTPYTGQTTDYNIIINESRTQDSIIVEITLQTASGGQSMMARLYVAYAEDTVFYQAPNNEDQHYDVFRKAFTADQGEQVLLPVPGNAAQYRFAIARNQTWDMNQMRVIAMINDLSNKEVLQAASYKSQISTGIAPNPDREISVNVFPNPVDQFVKVQTAQSAPVEISLFDLTGKLQLRSVSAGGQTELDLSEFNAGAYLMEIRTDNGFATRTIFKR